MDLTEIHQLKNHEHSQRHPWEKSRLDITKYFITKYSPDLVNLSVLDIGCGDGYILEELQYYFKKGIFIGVDPGFSDDYLADKNARSHSKNILFCKQVTDIPGEYMDHGIAFVLLMDVLEHIEKDHEFLSELAKESFISKETFLLITVPSFRFLFTSHDRFLRHFRRYSNQELIKSIRQNGFAIANSGYFFFSLLPVRIMNLVIPKILNRRKEARSSNLHWRGGKLLSNIVEKVLLLDFKAGQLFNRIGIKIPGLSNYAICKKSV